jgi:hypothetical protein
MLPDDSQRQLKILRAKERLLGVILLAIPLTATVLYVLFLKDKVQRPRLGLLVVLEWLVLFFVYLIVVSKMRRRRH